MHSHASWFISDSILQPPAQQQALTRSALSTDRDPGDMKCLAGVQYSIQLILFDTAWLFLNNWRQPLKKLIHRAPCMPIVWRINPAKYPYYILALSKETWYDWRQSNLPASESLSYNPWLILDNEAPVTIAENYSQHTPAKYPHCVTSEHCSRTYEMFGGDPIFDAFDNAHERLDFIWTIEAPVNHWRKVF